METKAFLSLLDERIHAYDLLRHPFYKAWSAGEPTRDDFAPTPGLFPHVDAFPGYLAQLGVRLEEGELRRAVLANMTDEKGGEDSFGQPERSHSELWLDFVEGLGGGRVPKRRPVGEVRKLVSWFHRVASEGTPEEALAAFYAYESQVPRIAQEKDRVLRERYGADENPARFHVTRRCRRAPRPGVAHPTGEEGQGQSGDGEESLGRCRDCGQGSMAVMRLRARRLGRASALASS